MSAETRGKVMNINIERYNFARDVIVIAIADVFASLTGILILPALTKNVSSLSYGIWVQTTVTLALLTPIVTLHLGTALTRFIASEEDETKEHQHFATVIWAVCTIGCIILLLSFSMEKQLSLILFKDIQFYIFVRLASFWIVFNALFTVSLSYLRAKRLINKLAFFNIVYTFLKMLIIFVFAISGANLMVILILLIGQTAIFSVILVLSIFKKIRFFLPNLEILVKYLKFSIPLIPMGILLWINNASDRYFITYYLDLSKSGIYSASYAFGSIVTLLYAPVGYVLFPNLTKFWENNETTKVTRYVNYSIGAFLFLAVPVAVGLTFLSKTLLIFFTTSEYFVGSHIIFLIATASVLFGVYQISVYALLLKKKTILLLLFVVVSAAINTSFNIVLIPMVGIVGAAISTIASYLILTSLVFSYAMHSINISFNLKFLTKLTISVSVMTFALLMLPHNTPFLLFINITICIIVYLLCAYITRLFGRYEINMLRQVIRLVYAK